MIKRELNFKPVPLEVFEIVKCYDRLNDMVIDISRRKYLDMKYLKMRFKYFEKYIEFYGMKDLEYNNINFIKQCDSVEQYFNKYVSFYETKFKLELSGYF